jgi:hypothetical protein
MEERRGFVATAAGDKVSSLRLPPLRKKRRRRRRSLLESQRRSQWI